MKGKSKPFVAWIQERCKVLNKSLKILTERKELWKSSKKLAQESLDNVYVKNVMSCNQNGTKSLPQKQFSDDANILSSLIFFKNWQLS